MKETDCLSDWYDSVRPRGYPGWERIVVAAQRILKQLGGELEPGDLVFEIWDTLRTNLQKFDHRKGNLSKPVDERFLEYFAHWFKKRIAQKLQRSRNRRRKEQVSLRSYAVGRPTTFKEPSTSREEIYWGEARRRVSEALNDLEAEDKAFVRYRYIEELTLKRIAEELHLSERTIKRGLAKRYKLGNLVRLVRERMRDRFFRLPRIEMYVEMFMLLCEYQLTVEEVASLLCVSVEELVRLHLQIVSQYDRVHQGERKDESLLSTPGENWHLFVYVLCYIIIVLSIV